MSKSDWMEQIDKPAPLAKRRKEKRRKWKQGDVYHRTRRGRGVVGRLVGTRVRGGALGD
jgi:hypothetical protein